jgi:hypothetical protein
LSPAVCGVIREFDDIVLALEIANTYEKHQLYLNTLISNSFYLKNTQRPKDFEESLQELTAYFSWPKKQDRQAGGNRQEPQGVRVDPVQEPTPVCA